MRRLGRFVHRWSRAVVALWLVIVVLGLAAATGSLGNESLFSRLQAGDAPTVPGESRDGAELLARASGETTSTLLMVDGLDVADPEVSTVLQQSRSKLTAITHVMAVSDPQNPPVSPSPFVSADGRALLVSVQIGEAGTALDGDTRRATDADVERVLGETAAQLTALVPQGPPPVVRIGGLSQLVDEINHHVETDLRIGEAIALPLSLLVMVVVFGGLLAAGLPIVGAIASIAGGLASLLGFSYLIDLDASVPSVVSILGLGLCIDYGLLVVSRYREELRRHDLDDGTRAGMRRAFADALENTVATAGRTVLFSGITVAISLTGLMFFRASILRAIAAAGVSVVLVAMLVALTLVPALLSIAGPRLLRPGISHRVPLLRRVAARLGEVAPEHGVFSRLAGAVQRHPLVVMLGSLAVLALAAVPVLRIEVISSGVSLLPASSTQRQLIEQTAIRFPQTATAPIIVVSDGTTEQLTAWAQPIAGLPGVASVQPVTVAGGANAAADPGASTGTSSTAGTTAGAGTGVVTQLGVVPDTDPRLSQARDVVTEIRDLARHSPPSGFQVWVTGETATIADFNDDLRERAPYAVGTVVLATFLLLFLMTGSVLIPVKALLMNVVSLGAAMGVLVWVFQEGHLQGLLQYTSNGGIDQNLPPLMLAFAFGLSMDYEVFLLARIKEARDRLVAEGMDAGRALNDIAVRQGLQRSGRIITSAGLIIVIVFTGFVAGKLLLIKEIGVGLAAAVIIDATLVRMLLVPATMTLLGELNWWAPGPLRRLHQRFGLSEG